MDELDMQIQRSCLRTLEELKTNEKWSELKMFYKSNFEKIESLVFEAPNMRSINEDIRSLNEELISNLFKKYGNDLYTFMKDINLAIKNGIIKENSL